MRKIFDNIGRTNARIPVDWKPGSIIEAVTNETFRYMEFEGVILNQVYQIPRSEIDELDFVRMEIPFGD